MGETEQPPRRTAVIVSPGACKEGCHTNYVCISYLYPHACSGQISRPPFCRRSICFRPPKIPYRWGDSKTERAHSGPGLVQLT
ncbi:hypothetical protein CPSG_03619 [Coccidioides posadasii str. Silveira]|uniref:Uncharacterized protein n=1 Tax=Coccidioides posadasii (strain RMSCC 757 / Silveira) TaxID=443226 RepID=E9D221_COCPS|nr:hypothetical protein CPSG_03619 [Coccidioides posadasii str. Silveira]